MSKAEADMMAGILHPLYAWHPHVATVMWWIFQKAPT